MGGERRSMSAEGAADEIAEAGSGTGESRSGPSPARDQWSAWERSVPGRPGGPPASGEDAPHDRAGTGTQAGTPPARPDEAPNHPDPAETRQEADVEEGEAGEDEEAAPSPWSIPLTLVGDLSGSGEEDDRQPTGPDPLADKGGTEAAAAGTRRAPEATDFDVWSRAPRAGGVEKAQSGPTETDGDRGREEPEEAAQAGARAARASQVGEGADSDAQAPRADRDAGPDAGARAPRAEGDAGTDGAARATLADGDADTDGAAWADTDGAARADTDGADRPLRTERDADADAAARAPRADGGAGADGDSTASKASGGLAADRDGGQAGTGGDTRASQDSEDVGDSAAPGRATADSTAGPADSGAASRTRGDAAAGADASNDKADADTGTGSRAAHGSVTPAAGPVLRTTSEAREAAPPAPPNAAGQPSAEGAQATKGAQATEGAQATKGAQATEGARASDGAQAKEAAGGPAAGRSGPPAGTQNDQGRASRSDTPEGNAVVIVPGVARYHRSACILIRFLGADDLETSTMREAEANGCAPCRACEPQKPLSDGT